MTAIWRLLIGSAEESCVVPTEPVPFGHKHWLAQHRWIEPLVGLAALLPVGGLYLLTATVLSSAGAVALAAVWVGFFVAGIVLRITRPCTVLRLPIHALLVLLIVLGTASATGLAAG